MKQKPVRQGDILLMPVKSIPKGGDTTEASEMTVALGEATGHHHTLYPTIEKSSVSLIKVNGREFLDVDPGYFLRHQEHGQHDRIEGLYEILREEEYCPFSEQMKKVVD